MLDIKNHESVNEFPITGVLNTIKAKKGTSAKTNDDYIGLTVELRVDQEVGGEMTENMVTLNLMANRHKKVNGKPSSELNKLYDRYNEYVNTFIPVSLETDSTPATRITAKAAIRENSFLSKTGTVINDWRLDTNFLNEARASDEEGAQFKVTGTVVGINPELDKQGDETGRLFVKICLIGYAGRANVIEFVAKDAVAEHIERNWEKGYTVKIIGKVVATHAVIEVKEDLGVGDAQISHKTISKRELLITGCSEGALDDSESFDPDDIKVALDERKAYLATLTEKPKAAPKTSADYGF